VEFDSFRNLDEDEEVEVQMAERYSPTFKFQVAMELLEGDKSAGQVAKAYGVHPNTVNNWKQKLMDTRPEVFAKDGTVAEYERCIADLEHLLRR
jgi:transposase-like protein